MNASEVDAAQQRSFTMRPDAVDRWAHMFTDGHVGYCQVCDGDDVCTCPGRVPVREAMELILERIERHDPELFDLCDQGDARIGMCADGDDAWAWWVTIRDEPDVEGWGTDYVVPNDRRGRWTP